MFAIAILPILVSMPLPEATDFPQVISNTRSDWGGQHSCDVETWTIRDKETGETSFTINVGGCII